MTRTQHRNANARRGKFTPDASISWRIRLTLAPNHAMNAAAKRVALISNGMLKLMTELTVADFADPIRAAHMNAIADSAGHMSG